MRHSNRRIHNFYVLSKNLKRFVVWLWKAAAVLSVRLRELNVAVYTNKAENEQSKTPLADVTFICFSF
jgi:hypothetical protein